MTKRTQLELTSNDLEVMNKIKSINCNKGYNIIDYVYVLKDNQHISMNNGYYSIYSCYERPSQSKKYYYGLCETFAHSLTLLNLNLLEHGITSYNIFRFTYSIKFNYKKTNYLLVLTDRTTKLYIERGY